TCIVDRGAWSMAWRRDAPADGGEKAAGWLVGHCLRLSSHLLDGNPRCQLLRCRPGGTGHGHLVLDHPWHRVGRPAFTPAPSSDVAAASLGCPRAIRGMME